MHRFVMNQCLPQYSRECVHSGKLDLHLYLLQNMECGRLCDLITNSNPHPRCLLSFLPIPLCTHQKKVSNFTPPMHSSATSHTPGTPPCLSAYKRLAPTAGLDIGRHYAASLIDTWEESIAATVARRKLAGTTRSEPTDRCSRPSDSRS